MNGYIFIVFLWSHTFSVIGVKIISEYTWTFACHALEKASEMLGILEAEVVGYDAYARRLFASFII